MRLYFAFGSNMWDAQMQKRCPQSRKIGRATLHGYRWIIAARGYASVVASPGDVVEGVLFEMTPEDEAELDRYEGVARGDYYKAELPVQLVASELASEVIALVYIDFVTEEGQPKEEYIHRINAGLRDAQLPREYVKQHVRRFVPEVPIQP